MSNQTTEATSPATSAANPPIRDASIVAGTGIVLMAALGVFGNLVVIEADVLAQEGLFRVAVVALYLVVVLDVVVAWALLHVFSPVNQQVSHLAAWFRLAYAAVFAVAISQLVSVPKRDVFEDIWSAGLILFGAHLVLIGWLAYRSGYVPRWLGILLVVAGAGYAFDSFAGVLTPDFPITVSTVTFLGEFLLAVWLLIRGRHTVVARNDDGI
ncbi:DUF4386 domain-containing protein [Aeromicrobium sp.]|uniref:DUF4386 domain-containing protein n=1 Tax=Aeromicrobium sp. TaxID=1871063 RepID=UPI003D6AFB32